MLTLMLLVPLLSPIPQIEVATGSFPYDKFKTPFHQVNAVVHGPSPALPEDGFSAEFKDFVHLW